jgi:hypothetical protein
VPISLVSAGTPVQLKTSSTSHLSSITADSTPGDFVVVILAVDNATGDTDTSIPGLTLTARNSGTPVNVKTGRLDGFQSSTSFTTAVYGNTSGGAGNGVVVVIAYCWTTTDSLNEVNASWTTARTARCSRMFRFRGVDATDLNMSVGASTGASISTSTGVGPQAGWLVIFGFGHESIATVSTIDSDTDGGPWAYTTAGTQRWTGTSGGGAATNISLFGNYKILNTAIASTFNITLSASARFAGGGLLMRAIPDPSSPPPPRFRRLTHNLVR